jgi:DNA-binding NarL/FixJ family response regulator
VRVALAEDSVLLRDGLSRLLNDEGFEVVAQCQDAAELMRKLSAYEVDVVIVDIRLPPTHTDEGCARRSRSARATRARRYWSSLSTSSLVWR